MWALSSAMISSLHNSIHNPQLWHGNKIFLHMQSSHHVCVCVYVCNALFAECVCIYIYIYIYIILNDMF